VLILYSRLSRHTIFFVKAGMAFPILLQGALAGCLPLQHTYWFGSGWGILFHGCCTCCAHVGLVVPVERCPLGRSLHTL
jgi:hypothetical protein